MRNEFLRVFRRLWSLTFNDTLFRIEKIADCWYDLDGAWVKEKISFMGRLNDAKKWLLWSVLTLSVVANILLIFWYFYKIDPMIVSLKKEVSSLTEESQKPIPKTTNEPCEKTYYIGEGPRKIVCIKKSDSRSEVLSKCSAVTNDNLSGLVLKGSLKGVSVNDVEKTRDLLIKMCMEEMGYEY